MIQRIKAHILTKFDCKKNMKNYKKTDFPNLEDCQIMIVLNTS